MRVNESAIAAENRDLKRRMQTALTHLDFVLMGPITGAAVIVNALECAHRALSGATEPAAGAEQ